MFVPGADDETEIVQTRWSVGVPQGRKGQSLFGKQDRSVQVGRISPVRIAGAQADPEVVQEPERLRGTRRGQGHRLLFELDRHIEVRWVRPLVVAGPETDREVAKQTATLVRRHPSNGQACPRESDRPVKIGSVSRKIEPCRQSQSKVSQTHRVVRVGQVGARNGCFRMRDRQIEVSVVAPVVVPETEQECQTVVCSRRRLGIAGRQIVREGSDVDCTVEIHAVASLFKALAQQVSQCLGSPEGCEPIVRPACRFAFTEFRWSEELLCGGSHCYGAVECCLVTRINRVPSTEIEREVHLAVGEFTG